MTREELQHEIRKWLYDTAGLRQGGSILLALDVCGSLNEKDFVTFKQVASEFDADNKYDVYYCFFSYEVWAHAPIEEFTKPKLELGSSNYSKVFKVALEQEHDAVVAFTDGWGQTPFVFIEPQPTLWVLMHKLSTPRWGQLIEWKEE